MPDFGLRRTDHNIWIMPDGVNLTLDAQQAKRWPHAQEAADWLADDRYRFFAFAYEARPIPDLPAPDADPSSNQQAAA